jgi:hypothetical protein
MNDELEGPKEWSEEYIAHHCNTSKLANITPEQASEMLAEMEARDAALAAVQAEYLEGATSFTLMRWAAVACTRRYSARPPSSAVGPWSWT